MKIKEFTYTKANGDVSQRALIELVSPTTHYEGIDVSDLELDAYADFVQKLNAMENVIAEQRKSLFAEFDLTQNYRRFSPERMTNITSDYA